MRHYCTYFDSHYLLRGVTLFRSMQKHIGDFTLWVLCCDEAAFEAIQTLDIVNLRPVRLSEVESFEPRLADVKPGRERVEYLWTLSPIWPLYLLDKQPEIEVICYLDADLCFFADDEPVWREFGDASVLIIEHRFAPRCSGALSGRFNVGMVAYRRDPNGLECLNWYRERCLEWCFDRFEEGLYGDQKYLDQFPQLFDKVHILEHIGANVAPWNRENYALSRRNNGLMVDDKPLIFFHFHGFKIFGALGARFYDPCATSAHFGGIPQHWRRLVFAPYLRALSQTRAWARARGVEPSLGTARFGPYEAKAFIGKTLRFEWGLSRL